MMFTKVLICLSVAIVAEGVLLNPQEFYQKFLQLADVTCRGEHSVTSEEVINSIQTIDTPRNIKCFYRCVHENCGFIKNDQYDRDTIVVQLKHLIGEENSRSLLDTCIKDYRVSDNCEIGYLITKCYREEVKKYLP